MATERYVDTAPMCDIHKFTMGDPNVPAQYDARTSAGQWANMCEPCWLTHSAGGLGTGIGQRLIVGEEPVRDRAAEVRAAMDRKDVTLSEIEDIVGDGDLADFL